MGRAYTDEEKEVIKKKIWEEGLKFFHDENANKLNIREIAANAGISLGSFYNFYPNKESLVRDICVYRANQKLDIIRATFSKAKKNPHKYLFDIISFNFIDMSEKITNKTIYADAFSEITGENGLALGIYAKLITDFFEDMEKYLSENGMAIRIDAKGLWNMIIALDGMYSVYDKLDKKYAKEIFDLYLNEAIKKYVKY